MSRRQSVSDEKVKKLENELADSTIHKNQLKANLDASELTLKNIEKQLEAANSQLSKTKDTLKSLENDNDNLRSQKNKAIDERDEIQSAKEKQEAEIERLKTDILDLTAQLKKAIDGKCEALSKSDEILSKASVLEQKERRLEQEKVLLDNQIQNLTNDLNRYLLDIQNMQSIHTSKVLTLETDLVNKTEELNHANSNIVKLSEINAKLMSENDKLASNTVMNSNADMILGYKKELEAKTKLSEMYLTMADEAKIKYEELNNHVTELQMLKNTLTEKNNSIENEYNLIKINYESELLENNKVISALQAELESVNIQVKTSKEESLKKFLEDLSPSAAATCNLIKYKSLTQIYDEIVKLCDELSNIKKENAQLTQAISVLESDTQEKESKINQQISELNDVTEKNNILTNQNETINNELNKLKDEQVDNVNKLNELENKSFNFKIENDDLCKQVCYLLQHIQGKSNELNGDKENTDMSEEFVTFKDIQELQKNNCLLLKLVKELKSKLNHFKDCTESDENKPIISMLNKRIEELTYSQNHQSKIMDALTLQCDRYKKLYDEIYSHQNESSKNIQMDVETSSPTADNIKNTDPKLDALEIELADTKRRFDYQQNEYKKYRDEMLDNEKILTEQLEDMRLKLSDLNTAYVKCSSMSKTNAEKYEMLQRSIATYKKQIVSLEERNKIYDSSIVKQEETIKYLRDEVMESITKLTKTEVLLENLKQECKFLKDSEIRLIKERDLLRKERYSQSLINNDIEYLKVTEQKKDNEDKINLQIKLNMASKQCTDLQKQIKLEQDRSNEMKVNFERQLKHAEDASKELNAILTEKKSQSELIQEQLDVKTVMIEDLNKRLISLITSSSFEGNIESTKKVRDLENQLQNRQKQFETLQQQLVESKNAVKESVNKYNVTNEQLKKIENEFTEYKKTAEINLKSIQDSEKVLRDKALKLESEIKLQSHDVNLMDSNDLKSELSKTRAILDSLNSELKEKRSGIESANIEIQRLLKAVKNAEDKYGHELLLHSKDVQALKENRTQLSVLMEQVKQFKHQKDQYESDINKLKTNLNSQETELIGDYQEMKSSITELKNQNSILHEQLQKFNSRKVEENVSMDSEQSEEHLLHVVKYLKQEKDILDTKFESIKAENSRMKSELDMLQKQLSNMKYNFESDKRTTNNAPMIIENSEIMHKIETLHAVTDSNIILRQERDNLLKQVKELSLKSTQLDELMKTTSENNADLTTRVDSLQTENTNLKSEINRWKARVNALAEKANKTGSEDWKRLQNEREMLAKKLTTEKETSKKFSDEVITLKMDKVKIDEQITTLKQSVKALSEERDKQANELNIVKVDMSKVTQELLEAKQSLTENIDANNKLTETLTQSVSTVSKLNERDAQLRNMARKYKTQYETLLKSTENNSGASSNNDLQKQLQEANKKNEDLQKVIDAIRENQSKEEKCKQELLEAKLRLDEINSNLTRELNEANTTLGAVTQKRDECDSQLSNLKTSYSELATKFACEKSQLEQDRRNEMILINRRVELLLQKINATQNDNISKPSTSSNHVTAITETIADNLNTTGITTSDISSSLSSSQSIIENLPSSSSTITQFPTQHIDLVMAREENNEVSEDVESNQIVNTVVQKLHQAISSPTPRNEASSETNREIIQIHQQASSSSSNNNSNSTVTTSDVNDDMESSQRSHKRSRQLIDQSEPSTTKRIKIQEVTDVDLEYEVPSSSQRDQEDDCCVVVDSADEDSQYQEAVESINNERKADCVKSAESRTEEMDTENIASVSSAVTTNDNEVEVIANSSQVIQGIVERNEADTEQSEISSIPSTSQSSAQGPQIETISSVTEGRGGSNNFLTLGVVAGGVGSGSYDEGNDSIVPSTPILYVPRRNDGFGEAVSSPVTSGRVSSGEDCFTFGEILPGPSSGVMDDTHADLTSQITPHLSDPSSDLIVDDNNVRMDDGNEIVPVAEPSNNTDEDVPTVSSQGSHPASPQQIDEGSEAEATTPTARNVATRTNWKKTPGQRTPSYSRSEYNTRAYSQRSHRGGRPNRRPQNQYRRN